MQNQNMHIRVERGALDDVPYNELIPFLNRHGLVIQGEPSGMVIRRDNTPQEAAGAGGYPFPPQDFDPNLTEKDG